jgi:protein-S-isoprenylcysteine O-methyltransferase Ste14
LDSSTFYRIVLIVIFSSLTVVRVSYRIVSGAVRDRIFSPREGMLPVVLRWILGLPLLYATGASMFAPGSNPWMYVSVPIAGRAAGILMGFAAVLVIFLVHRELGACFSSTLVIRENHRLIRTGPYRFVRHPMYSAYLMLFIGAFLVSGNWVIGGCGVAVIATLMTVRLAREEAMLAEAFGAEHDDYRAATGMFIPMTHTIPRVVRAARSALRARS